MWQTIINRLPLTIGRVKTKEKEAVVVWTHLQTQQHHQGVVAKWSQKGREGEESLEK